MRQAQKTNTESTPTSLQRKEEKNTEHSNKLAEFVDNRASIVSQRKLSETIGQKEAKILRSQCGNSSAGRAIPCQGIGREFEPRFPLHFSSFNKRG